MKISFTLMWKTEVVMTKGGTDLSLSDMMGMVLCRFWSSFVMRIVFIFMSQQGQGEEGGIICARQQFLYFSFTTMCYKNYKVAPACLTVTFLLDTVGIAVQPPTVPGWGISTHYTH